MNKAKLLKRIAILTASTALTLAIATGCGNDGGTLIDIMGKGSSSTSSSGSSGSSGSGGSGDASDPSATNNPIDASQLDGTADVTPPPQLSYDEYRAMNSDVVGWIKIADTNIDYPIVQSHDNADYLTQSVDKVASKAGAIFVDYRCTPESEHVIVYGHNMSKSKIMFAQLSNYSNRDFYDNHRTFTIKWGDTDFTYKVFAVYSVDVNDAQYMPVSFGDTSQFADYFNNTLSALSQFPVDTTINPGDQVVTLSTCTHTDYANGRFVVHAVRVDNQ